MFLSVVSNSSKPAASAAAMSSPLVSLSHPVQSPLPPCDRSRHVEAEQGCRCQIERASTVEAIGCIKGGASRLRAANSITVTTCSWDKWNHSIISEIEAPTSRLSNTTETGIRVSRNTHAPLRLPGMLSTAAHRDQSRLAMFLLSFHRNPTNAFGVAPLPRIFQSTSDQFRGAGQCEQPQLSPCLKLRVTMNFES